MVLRQLGALVVASVLPIVAHAQQNAFVGEWLLWVESGYEARPAYGTLAIETRGLKKGVWDAPGMPISSDGVFTERWYLDDEGRLHIEFSLDDPENYHRPALMHQIRYKQPDDKEISPYSCDPHPFYRGLDLEGRLEEYWGRSRYRL